MENTILEAAQVRPSARQLAWQETEFYAFVHFSPNTFTDMEWGLGSENPSVFNPTALDARQWVDACKSAGMRGLILTCKHHDGFCLWPSEFTDHSVKSSPWKGGRGDIVREVSDACREGGIKFGVYLSPWDRHEKTYGDSPTYNRYFVGQLTELLTNYGPVFSVWFDGACGEGPNGKRQVYDWESYYKKIRELQPDACISVCGPDVRWCGNEAGHCRTSEWSVVPETLRDAEKVIEKSQKVDDGDFSKRYLSNDEDLGSRRIIQNAGHLIWYPAEVNTSIRPGWFYHSREDDRVRPLNELLHIYYSSVGGNGTFLLNIPPDTRGLFHENDVSRLKEIGEALRSAFAVDLAKDASVSASESLNATHAPQNLLDQNKNTCWRPKDGTEMAEVTLRFGSEQTFDRVVLMEHIASSGQRIESFSLEYEQAGQWSPFFHGTVVGYKKICLFDTVKSGALRLKIEQSRVCPTLSYIGVFDGEQR
jgi:alpha-L-fucosidase